MPHRDLSFAVIGAGAIGSSIAWHLAHAGADVVLVGRGEHLQRIGAAGLSLRSASTDDRTHPIEIYTDVSGLKPRDVIFLCTKAQDLASAVESAAPLIGGDSVVVPTINGLPWWYGKGLHGDLDRPMSAVDPDRVLWDRFEAPQIIGAVVHFGASLESPGVVRQTPSPRLILGELDGRTTPRIERLVSTLTAGGLQTEIERHIRDAVWSKLLGNIATNPLSVVCGATLDRLFQEPALATLVRAQMAETLAVGAACGIRFEQGIQERIEIGRKLGAFRTSMLQDFDRARPLELGAIADAVLEMADRQGIDMPVTRMVVGLAREAERNRRMESNGQLIDTSSSR